VDVGGGMVVCVRRHDDGREGKEDKRGLVVLDRVASTMYHCSVLENGKLEHSEMWTRLPRRSHVFGISSAGNEDQHSSCEGGHGKPHDSDSKVERPSASRSLKTPRCNLHLC